MTIKYLKKSPKTSSTDDKKTREIVQQLLDDLKNSADYESKNKFCLIQTYIMKSFGKNTLGAS